MVLARGRTCRRYRNSLLYLLRRMGRLLCHCFLFVPHSYNSQRQLLQVAIQLSIRRLQMSGLTKVRQVYLLWFSGDRWWYLCYIFIGCLKDKKKSLSRLNSETCFRSSAVKDQRASKNDTVSSISTAAAILFTTSLET